VKAVLYVLVLFANNIVPLTKKKQMFQ